MGIIMKNKIRYTGGGDYNTLNNKPIINMTGTVSSPIILNTLPKGEYNITGKYAYVESEASQGASNVSILMSVASDAETGNKVITYENIENGILYIYNLLFENDGVTYQLVKTALTQQDKLVFVDSLPAQGESDIAYVLGADLYRWDSTTHDYYGVGTPTWESY